MKDIRMSNDATIPQKTILKQEPCQTESGIDTTTFLMSGIHRHGMSMVGATKKIGGSDHLGGDTHLGGRRSGRTVTHPSPKWKHPHRTQHKLTAWR